jgi:putative (di)nucleoside polyphosphate hydrolase
MQKTLNKSLLPYRQGVGIILLNDKNQVFTACRIDTTTQAWQMPQGGIDAGETPQQAVLRELEEETSITNIDYIAVSKDWLRYDLPENLIDKLWHGRYRGQEQMWYLYRFTGKESEINLATTHPEFHSWKWTEFMELPNMIVPFKRPLYEQIVQEFSEFVEKAL